MVELGYGFSDSDGGPYVNRTSGAGADAPAVGFDADDAGGCGFYGVDAARGAQAAAAAVPGGAADAGGRMLAVG